MRLSRTILLLLTLIAATLASAESWSDAYAKALEAYGRGDWREARTAFKQAAALRADDSSEPTTLAGSVIDPVSWREGEAYSPNFGAALCFYRAGMESRDDGERQALLRDAAVEFEKLLEFNQHSAAAYYYLSRIYSRLDERDSAAKLDTKLSTLGKLPDWRVDSALVPPDEQTEIVALMKRRSNPEPIAIVQPPTAPPVEVAQPVENPTQPVAEPVAEPKPEPAPRTNPLNPTEPPPAEPKPAKTTQTVAAPGQGVYEEIDPATGLLRVIRLPSKFALVVGNADSMLPEGTIPFAASDAQLVAQTLTRFGGYEEGNVVTLTNVTAADILIAAQELANRMPEGDNTVVIYFTGQGVNLDNQDYLAGVNTRVATDSSSMLKKADLFQVFLNKGAKLFAFFQVPRTFVEGRYFGQERTVVGRVAQMQATVPGENVFSIVRNGQAIGLFTGAFSTVLEEFRSNQIPVYEFAWQVFFAMRGGTSESGEGTGLGSYQTCTLPTITNMDLSLSRF